MKKILLILLAVVMVLPVVVKADTIYWNSFYNKNTTVGGEVEVHLVIEDDELAKNLTVEFSYDPTMLKISKDMIDIEAKKEVTIENGKVKVLIKELEYGLDNYGHKTLNLRFTALKEGSTEISINFSKSAMYATPTDLTINISNKEECPVCEQCDCSKEDKSTEDKTCEPCECNKEENKPVEEKKCEKTEASNSNNLFLYCSLGLNALLLIGLILAIVLKKKSTKPVEKEIEKNNE